MDRIAQEVPEEIHVRAEDTTLGAAQTAFQAVRRVQSHEDLEDLEDLVAQIVDLAENYTGTGFAGENGRGADLGGRAGDCIAVETAHFARVIASMLQRGL